MLFCVAILGIAPVFAQPCAIDQPEGNAFLNISDATAVGQTFTACGTGYVTAIEVDFYIQTVNTLTLQMSAGTNTLSPEYTQEFEANSTGKVLIQLTTPFAVQDLQSYTFTVVGLAGSGAAGSLLGFNGNPYTGGNAITETGGAVTNFGTDLTFGLTIVTDACVIDQDTRNAFANVSTSTAVGQTFTACNDGAITMIRINYAAVSAKAFTLQISSGTNTLTPGYSQDFEPGTVGDAVIVLSTPFIVQSGQQYAFTVIAISGTGVVGDIWGFNGNPYPNGNAITETGGAVTNFGVDLDFSVTIAENACVIAQPDANAFFNISTAISAGQTFTACETGYVTHVKTNFYTAPPAELKLAMSAGTNTLTPEYTQNFVADSIGDYLIQLTTPFKVISGQSYAFSVGAVSGTGNLLAFNGNPYTGGNAFNENAGVVTNFGTDLVFSILTLACSPASAGFTSTSTELVATFTDGSAMADAVVYDFGDGTTSSDPNPTHTYAAAGTYTVCQIANNSCQSDTVCVNVVVTCTAPTAGFTASAFNGLDITFTDASQNATSVLYDFGDGNTSTSASPTHKYAASGVYTVCQTTTNDCESNSTCIEVSVIATGIEDVTGLTVFQISPNPGTGLFQLDVEVEARSQMSLEVFTIQGTKVMSKEYGWVNGSMKESIDLREVSRGIYFARLQVNGETVTQKLILE